MTFEEFLLIEAFDLDKKVKYMYTPNVSKLLSTIYPNANNNHAWMFTVNGTEYILYTLTQEGFTEIHFGYWTNEADLKSQVISKNATEVFGYVMRIIYDIKDKAYMNDIRIICPLNRKELYDKLFDRVKEYFSEYTKTQPHKHNDMTDKDGNKLPTSAFELIKGKFSKGVTISELKEQLRR